MELSYVWHAVKRFWWAVVICAVLGTAFGLTRVKPMEFTSRSTLQINSSSNSSEAQDRRVATEVGRLSTPEFAEKVAGAIHKDGITGDDIQRDVIVANTTGSDLIDIIVTAKSGPLAQLIAKKYVATYLGLTPKQGTDSPQVANLKSQRDAVQRQLDQLNIEIDRARPNVPADLTSRAATLQSVVGSLASSIATAQPTDSGGPATVVQSGTNPRATGKGKVRTVAPFMLAALFAGVLLAVVLARLSRWVLDGEEVEEILGVPVHGRLPQGLNDAVRHGRWWRVSPETATFFEELCTRVESCERRGRGITVLVAGSEATTNSIAVAALMSSRFGLWGLDVVFGGADGDATDLFNRLGRPRQNLTGVIAEADSETTTRIRQLPRPPLADEDGDAASAASQMTFVGMSDEADALALRRYGPEAVLGVLSDAFDVVVLAVGPLLEARAAAQLANLVDVVVLAVPVERQSRKRLQAVARQVAGRRGSLIVVDDRDGKGGTGEPVDAFAGLANQAPTPTTAPQAAPRPPGQGIERPGSLGGSA
jgi:capsular polysaccharide biosynthesis protein